MNVVASFVLPSRAQEAAGHLVGVHDAVCADSVCAHQPAQLDEQPVRVGVLLLRTVELFHALELKCTVTQELIDPSLAWMGVESLFVEPFAQQTSDRHRAEGQDVGHSHDVLTEPCHVCG